MRRAQLAPGEAELVRLQGSINAEPVVAALRANGIPARIIGEALGSLYGLTLDGLGEVVVAVPEEHLDAARDLLAAGAQGLLEADESE